MCCYSPPDFPKETRYLITVFIQILTLTDSKQTVAWHEPCLRMLLEPVTEFLGWVSHKFPFDANHQHNWAPLSSVWRYLFSVSSSSREESVINFPFGLFFLFVCGKQWTFSCFLRLLISWRTPEDESFVLIVGSLTPEAFWTKKLVLVFCPT